MLKRRVLLSLAVFAVLIPAAVRAAEEPASLAASLPADKTVAYVHLDLQRTLDQASKGLVFLDPTAAEKIQFQVKDLYSMVRELAAHYDVKPSLLDHLAETDVYLVVIAKGEPETTVHTIKTPKYRSGDLPGDTGGVRGGQSHRDEELHHLPGAAHSGRERGQRLCAAVQGPDGPPQGGRT